MQWFLMTFCCTSRQSGCVYPQLQVCLSIFNAVFQSLHFRRVDIFWHEHWICYHIFQDQHVCSWYSYFHVNCRISFSTSPNHITWFWMEWDESSECTWIAHALIKLSDQAMSYHLFRTMICTTMFSNSSCRKLLHHLLIYLKVLTSLWCCNKLQFQKSFYISSFRNIDILLILHILVVGRQIISKYKGGMFSYFHKGFFKYFNWLKISLYNASSLLFLFIWLAKIPGLIS